MNNFSNKVPITNFRVTSGFICGEDNISFMENSVAFGVDISSIELGTYLLINSKNERVILKDYSYIKYVQLEHKADKSYNLSEVLTVYAEKGNYENCLKKLIELENSTAKRLILV